MNPHWCICFGYTYMIINFMVLLAITLKDAVQQHVSFHSTSVHHFALLTMPFLMAERFNLSTPVAFGSVLSLSL